MNRRELLIALAAGTAGAVAVELIPKRAHAAEDAKPLVVHNLLRNWTHDLGTVETYTLDSDAPIRCERWLDERGNLWHRYWHEPEHPQMRLL